MIHCRLAALMAEKKMKISDMARETGVPRSSITALYKETAERVDLESIETLCRYFECELGEFLYLADEPDQ